MISWQCDIIFMKFLTLDTYLVVVSLLYICTLYSWCVSIFLCARAGKFREWRRPRSLPTYMSEWKCSHAHRIHVITRARNWNTKWNFLAVEWGGKVGVPINKLRNTGSWEGWLRRSSRRVMFWRVRGRETFYQWTEPLNESGPSRWSLRACALAPCYDQYPGQSRPCIWWYCL